MRRILLIFFAFALIYAGVGLLPGRTLLPLDLLDDYGAWKADPGVRVRASNSLLSDPLLAFVPWDAAIRRTLGAGEIPWVDVRAGDGAPLWANPQTAMLSPFTWPRLLFGLEGWALAALLKLLVAGLGMVALGRELGLPRRQAVVSGLFYAGSGLMVVWLLFPLTQVAAWLPALAAAGRRLMQRPSRGSAGAVLLLAALATAGGHPETLFVGICGIALFLLLEARARPELGLQTLGRPALFAALGFLLLAWQVVPFLLVLRESAAAASRPAAGHPFRLWALVAEVLPGVLGSPLAGELDLTPLAGSENFNNRTGGYVGVLVLIAIAAGWRALSPALRRGLLIGGGALLLSLHPPLLTPLLKKLPVVGLLAFEYLAFLFALFASLAAGPALCHLAQEPRRRLGVTLLAIGVLAAVAGLLPALPAARPQLAAIARQGIAALRDSGHLRQAPAVYEERLALYLDAAGATTWRRLALPGLCLAIAGFALRRRELAPERRQLLVAGAAIAELVAFGWGCNPAAPRTTLPPEPPALATIRAADPQNHFLVASHLTIFPANLASLYGRRDLVSYDVLTSRSRSAALEKAGYDPLQHSLREQLTVAEVQELGRLGVRFVISREDVPGAIRLPGPPPPATGVYEIAGALPSPLPVNRPPAGFGLGLVLSLAACLGAAGALAMARPGAGPLGP